MFFRKFFITNESMRLLILIKPGSVYPTGNGILLTIEKF